MAEHQAEQVDMPVLARGEFCSTPTEGCRRHECGRPLTGRQVRWCSTECRDWYYRNHRWTQARREAMSRAGCGNPFRARCQRPGCQKPAEEVDHIIERMGTPLGENSCLHHQENLRALCHDCHVTRYEWDADVTSSFGREASDG